MKMKKRFLGILLSLVMLLGLLPGMSLTAYATTDIDVDVLLYNLQELMYQKAQESDIQAYQAYIALKQAYRGLEEAFFNAQGAITPEVETAYKSALAVYQQYSGGGHTHSWNYQASGASVTATCTGNGDCDYKTNGVTLTISAPANLECDGSAKAAAISGEIPGGSGLPDPSNITYNPGGSTAPTEPGDYTASFTWGGANASVNFTLTAPAHTHSFTYAASDATITASCGEAGCNLPESSAGAGDHVATLTIAANGGTYDGMTAYAATITDANSIQGDAKVQYQKKTDGSYGTATETAPKDAGDYKASITVGGATASVEYTVAQADPTATAPTGLTATYGQTLADVSLEGKNPQGNTPGTWAWVDSTQSVGDIVSPAATFKANFTPTSSNYKTVENVNVTVTVSTADNPVTYAEKQAVTKTFSTAAQTATLEAAKEAQGELSYGIISQKSGEEAVNYFTLDGTTMTLAANTPVGTYTVVVYARAAGNGNYFGGIRESTVTVTVNKADPTVTAPTAKTLTYTGSAQELVNAGSTNDGKLYYALTTEDKAPTDEKLYTTSIPTGTEAGTYYVWYKAKGDENHLDSDPKCVSVVIKKESVKPEVRVVQGEG